MLVEAKHKKLPADQRRGTAKFPLHSYDTAHVIEDEIELTLTPILLICFLACSVQGYDHFTEARLDEAPNSVICKRQTEVRTDRGNYIPGIRKADEIFDVRVEKRLTPVEKIHEKQRIP